MQNAHLPQVCPQLVVVLSSLITADFAVHQNAKEVTLTQFRDTIYRLSYEASSLVEDGWMNWRGRWSHNQFPFPFRFQWEDEREGGREWRRRPTWLAVPSSFLLPPLHCFGISGSLAALNVKAFGRHFFLDRLPMFWWPLTPPSELGKLTRLSTLQICIVVPWLSFDSFPWNY